MLLLLLGAAVLGAAVLARTLLCIPALRRKRPTGCHASVKTMAVLGSGGHSTEMLKLLKFLPASDFSPLDLVISATDTMSLNLLRAPENQRAGVSLHTIRRSREVGQSYISSVFTTLLALWDSLFLFLSCSPDLLLINGPGVCVPVAIVVFLANVLLFRDTRIVFVESFCRVDRLSLSGKLLYPIADRFVVQWPKLREQYPRSEYLGTLF